ncbi:MAG: MarC family protein, partial [Burkholderia cenocepacia]
LTHESAEALGLREGGPAGAPVVAAWVVGAPLCGHSGARRVPADTQRLMGMILAAIAMQMIVASLKAAFGLPH